MRIVAIALTCACLVMTGIAAETPRPSPSFSVLRVGDSPLPLNNYRGKVVALAFISTTCPHCQNLTKTLSALNQEFAPRGVQILECAFDAGSDRALPQFIEQYKPPFPIGYADRSAVLTYLQYSILDTRPVYVPHMVFLDRRGVIRADYPGENDFFQNPERNIRAELEKMLKAPAGGSATRTAK